MAAFDGTLYFFVALMLVAGAANTLLMKFQVMQMVPGGPGLPPSDFNHPFFQTFLMMIGEVLCLLAYFMTRRKQAVDCSYWLFLIPCLCDWTATTLVNSAFIFIPASVVQMTRGAIVIFTAMMSVMFLGRRQHMYHLVGVALVVIGITLVALSVFSNPSALLTATSTTNTYRVVGISLCISAQIFQASMLVYEEKILNQYMVPPLMVVGMEGFFGLFVGLGLLAVVNPMGVENTPVAIYQASHSTPLLIACIASIFSIALFNYSGVTVTQKASAVARSTIDCSRTILIWAVEISVGWNVFSWMQLAGFIILAAGTMLYNRIIVVQYLEPLEAETILLTKDKRKQASNV